MLLPSYAWRFAHLAALWGYGVSQPVFSLLRGNPEFLATNGATRAEVAVFGLVVAFGPPAAAVALEAAVGAWRKTVAALVHVIAIWVFGFAAATELMARFDPSSRATLLIPAVVSYAGAMAYARWPFYRSFLSVSAALPVAGLVLFVTTTSVATDDAKAFAVPIKARTPVVLVVFDEFPVSSIMRADGSVDALRYPGFGRLARGATWYSRAATVHDRTPEAVPAILTGDSPRGDALPTLGDHPRNLFTLLGGTYALEVHEPVTRLCPVRYCPDEKVRTGFVTRVGRLVEDVGIDYLHSVLPTELEVDLAPVREGWAARVGEAGNAGMKEFLESIDGSDRPQTLYVLHAIQPHEPWVYLPSGNRYNAGSTITGLREDWKPGDISQWRADELLVARGLQRHLLQVGYVDRFVSALLDRLHGTGLYDRALIVVTADHGVSIRPNGFRRTVARANIEDIALVPLFVKYPHEKHGREDRRDAATIDVLPTIADALGVQLPWHVDGISLRARPVRREVRVSSADGPSVTIEPSKLAPRLIATARRNARWLGEGKDSLYRLGPRQELVGRRVTSFQRSVADNVDLELPAEAALSVVRKESGYVPVSIVGRVTWAPLRTSDVLAVAINGRLAATTRPFELEGRLWLETLIDENTLREGRNSVGVYAVRGTGENTRLLLLGGDEGSAPTLASPASSP